MIETVKTIDINNRSIEMCRRVVTTESFIAEAKAIYGDKYDYSHVIYRNKDHRVTIICPKHGEFEIFARDHLDGVGCRKCKYETQFITKFIARFGNNYDLSKVNYKDSYTNVIIGCPVHGDFERKPGSLLSMDCACPECGKEKRIAQQLQKAKEIKEKVEEQKPHTNNLGGRIPPMKGNTARFIEAARKKFGDRYDYSLVDYKTTNTPVKIICRKHGVYEQKPCNHLKHNGCPQCAYENQQAKVKAKMDKKYTFEMCAEKAKECSSRSEFISKYPSYVQHAKQRGWYDQICEHMGEKVQYDSPRSIYVYEFKDIDGVNYAYVGLTVNKIQRAWNHANNESSAVYQLCKKHNLTVPLSPTKYLRDNITDPNEAALFEEEWRFRYIQEGWQMLNRIKCGGLGGGLLTSIKRLEETTMEEIKQSMEGFNHVSQWKNKYRFYAKVLDSQGISPESLHDFLPKSEQYDYRLEAIVKSMRESIDFANWRDNNDAYVVYLRKIKIVARELYNLTTKKN